MLEGISGASGSPDSRAWLWFTTTWVKILTGTRALPTTIASHPQALLLASCQIRKVRAYFRPDFVQNLSPCTLPGPTEQMKKT